MTHGEAYASGTLVRIRCDTDRPFTAGVVLHPDTQHVFVAAPILRHMLGRSADQLRAYIHRMGWRATIVRR